MKYTKSTRYALCAAMEMATSEDPVTVAAVAEAYAIPPGALAKVFQQLVRAGLARGVRGVGGGYVLTRPPSEITVLEVIAVHDLPRPEAYGDPRLQRLFDEVTEVVSSTFASVSLETLVR